ncbi:hypothetical protein E5A73_01115 [Sphingomonas gei]|uniref:Uncharacterized protein n=1 Tax=Sphingomonas gei TaxID=1395960 RepID=A0A4S1XGL2_9SPHN|nr:hypothetical protein [Sphingomonas gei]TGX55759.1 hypothetical protein E5A73_01115 [Sphingomonas gei]
MCLPGLRSIASGEESAGLAAKMVRNLGWALFSLGGLLILVKIGILVAQELRSAPLGVMAAALTLLLAITLRASLLPRRR